MRYVQYTCSPPGERSSPHFVDEETEAHLHSHAWLQALLLEAVGCSGRATEPSLILVLGPRLQGEPDTGGPAGSSGLPPHTLLPQLLLTQNPLLLASHGEFHPTGSRSSIQSHPLGFSTWDGRW